MTGKWVRWLDDLADGADRLEHQLEAGELLDFPQLIPPPLDPGETGLPSELMPRAREVFDRLERLERVARTQRDRVAVELQRLSSPRPRPRTVAAYDLGAALDVAG